MVFQAIYLVGITLAGGFAYIAVKHYISFLGDSDDDMEYDGNQKTRIRHEGGL